jgi:hypothetical protein
MLSVLTQYFALSLYGILTSFAHLVLLLPLVFLPVALPITAAHLGTSQAAWLLFFSGNALDVKILAYSLATHFTFMFLQWADRAVLPTARKPRTRCARCDDAK